MLGDRSDPATVHRDESRGKQEEDDISAHIMQSISATAGSLAAKFGTSPSYILRPVDQGGNHDHWQNRAAKMDWVRYSRSSIRHGVKAETVEDDTVLSGYRARVSLDDDRSRPSTIAQSHDAPPSAYLDEGDSEFESDNDHSRPSTIAQPHDVPSWVYSDEDESDVDSDDDHSSLSTIAQPHGAPSWVDLDEGESGVESVDDRSTTAQPHYAPSSNEEKSEVDPVELDEGSAGQPLTVTTADANRAYPCTWVSATGHACLFVLQPPAPPDEVGWLKVVRDHLKAVHSDDLTARPEVKGIICRWHDDKHGPKTKKQNGQVVCRDVKSIVRHIVHPHLQMTFMCSLCGEEIRRKDRHIKKCNSRATRDPVGDAVGL